MTHRVALLAPPLLALALSAILPSRTAADEIALFNGRDLTGWTVVSQSPGPASESVWTVADEVLLCRGNPVGYLMTDRRDLSDFSLSLEWRWPQTGGNSGVLLFVSKPNELGIWPKSLEVQLGSGDAGDFWVIGSSIQVPNEESRRQDRRFLNLVDQAEKPLGEWNRMEIQSRGGTVRVHVNGTLVNEATECSERVGGIALQSEGTEIHFRNIRLRLDVE